ncbi:hypothetical protein C0993_011784 [Termitomyces sp. T159_Od127]|nr:hypothetical protein C0993_011784 [Termitomyces sp. T159_Od127]
MTVQARRPANPIHQTRDYLQPLVITPGKEFNSKFGHYRHADLVGMPYGSKVGSRKGKGFIHVLRPTPELWTMALPHRTQILYLADIAFITSHLDIKPGSRVIEADGFTVEDTVDSGKLTFCVPLLLKMISLRKQTVFLDLPAPWEAVEHAKQALRKDRMTRICCFSPCMEQVLRTVNALNDAGFTDITMYETLLRPVDVSHVPVPQSICDISEKLKQAERKREEKRLQQIAAGKQNKRKRDNTTPVKDHSEEASEIDTAAGERKRPKISEESDTVVPEPLQEMDLDPSEELVGLAPSTTLAPSASPVQIPPTKINLSKVIPEVRGHTSYLTFASLIPFTLPETEPSTAAATPGGAAE